MVFLIMEIEEMKEKIADICNELGHCLPYEADQVEETDWDNIADELANLARIICIAGNRVAAHAGIARRKANIGGP
jgi:hypothetical protein